MVGGTGFGYVECRSKHLLESRRTPSMDENTSTEEHRLFMLLT